MKPYFEELVKSEKSLLDKLDEIKEIEKDLKLVKDIVCGKYTYCNECNDYYLSKSFLKDVKTKGCKICVYEDPINSGGNDYVKGTLRLTYRICPKGHKTIIEREEIPNT